MNGEQPASGKENQSRKQMSRKSTVLEALPILVAIFSMQFYSPIPLCVSFGQSLSSFPLHCAFSHPFRMFPALADRGWQGKSSQDSLFPLRTAIGNQSTAQPCPEPLGCVLGHSAGVTAHPELPCSDEPALGYLRMLRALGLLHNPASQTCIPLLPSQRGCCGLFPLL